MSPLTLLFGSLLIALAIFMTILYTTFYVPSLKQLFVFHKLPGPRYFPVIGAALELPFVGYAGTLNWLKKVGVERFKRISSIWMMGLPVVFVNSPPDIELILSSTKYLDKGEEYLTLKPWLQEGLLLSSGHKWHTRRKLLTPTFHFKILEDKAPTMITGARKFVDKLLAERGKAFDPYNYVSSCTLDIVCEAAMGVQLNSIDDNSTDYVTTIKRVSKEVIYRVTHMQFLSQWLWDITPRGMKNNRDTKILHAFTNKIIAERRAGFVKSEEDDSENEVGGKKRKAFLDRLLELDVQYGMNFTDTDIREEVDTFLFEGHDTTAGLILFSLFELGHHPEVQELAYQEQYGIFGDDKRDATFADVKEMKYLERVIKECLRLYPPVPYISRRIGEDLHLKDISIVPAGSNVIVTPIFLHRNPDYYPQPEKFDPDRFLPEECVKRHPFAYIPFSAGPRNCIGQKFAMIEAKIVLSTLLRSAIIESVTERSSLKLVPAILLRTVDPIQIKVLPRCPEQE